MITQESAQIYPAFLRGFAVEALENLKHGTPSFQAALPLYDWEYGG